MNLLRCSCPIDPMSPQSMDAKGAGSGSSSETRICFCYGVSEQAIREAIAKGATTLLAVQEATKASTGCGGCTEEVERLLKELLPSKGGRE